MPGNPLESVLGQTGLLGLTPQPAPALQVPSQPAPTLLDSVYSEYPALKKYDFKLKDSMAGGVDWRGEPYSGRKLEFYPPGEEYNPYPGTPTIEQFSKDMGSKDVLGEIFSHYLPSVDPAFGASKQSFLQSITQSQKEEMLKPDYENDIKEGTIPAGTTFEQWLSGVGGDAYFRGYIADQYPKDSYTPEQIKIFYDLMNRLKQSGN